MSLARALIGILGLAVLMIVHEGGHYFAARRFGMRVTKFSIGFGPTLWKHSPKGSPTTFQVALIPFLAYVQIAGMNPYEESDPKDSGSYANSSLWARVVTIAAGPLANYFFASILMFSGFFIGGKTVVDETSMRVHVIAHGPAAQAGIETGDRILTVNGVAVKDWDGLKKEVGGHAGEKIDIEIERGTERRHVFPIPAVGGDSKGRIAVQPDYHVEILTAAQAAVLSVTEPPKVVYESLKGLGQMMTMKTKFEVHGPVDIVKDLGDAAKAGTNTYLLFLGALSAYLGAFNLLPVPALDGGRLLFLGFEAASRRKADAKVEAVVHAIGLLMFLTLIVVITYKEVPKLFQK
jgi:regulator of sigma E protease